MKQLLSILPLLIALLFTGCADTGNQSSKKKTAGTSTPRTGDSQFTSDAASTNSAPPTDPSLTDTNGGQTNSIASGPANPFPTPTPVPVAPHLAEGAVVTDAGSVKVSVVEQLTPILGERFVGAHPMAGSELSGFDAARADLFAGAPCILTPLPTTPIRMLEAVSQFWSSLGAQVTTMSPVEHDRLVARISHLPHAIAFALVNLVAATLPPSSSQLAGGSFRDGTRVAASDPALWTGILSENRVEVIEAIREMSDLLQTLAGNLEAQEKDSVLDFLSQAKEHRGTLPLPTPDEIL